jgi:hypothetical protein
MIISIFFLNMYIKNINEIDVIIISETAVPISIAIGSNMVKIKIVLLMSNNLLIINFKEKIYHV